MFPGQSSRHPELIAPIAASDRQSTATVELASDILGRDLKAQYDPSNPSIFVCNRDVQVGIFLANHLHLDLVHRAGIEARWSLGLSLGEYNHLVHIGALTFEDALRLVEERGRLYDQGPPGVLVSVFPIEADAIEHKIEDLGLRDRVCIALYNSPRQQVLGGERKAVERLLRAVETDAFVEAVELERIPMHATLFSPVAERFHEVLAKAIITPPRLPYVPNVQSKVIPDADPDLIKACLKAHVCHPVRWRASIEAVAGCVPSAYFLEVGPGSVLHNLFGRGWNPGQRAKTDGAGGWRDNFSGLILALHNDV